MVGFCFIFYKTLALKNIQTVATNPHPWGTQGSPPGLFVAVFLCPFPGIWCQRAGAGVLGRVEFVQHFHGEMVTRKETRTR